MNSVWNLTSFLCPWNILVSYKSCSSVKGSGMEMKNFESSEYMWIVKSLCVELPRKRV